MCRPGTLFERSQRNGAPAVACNWAGEGKSTSATVTAGQMATYQLVLTATNYSGTITFSCTGAPAGDSCSVPSPVKIHSRIRHDGSKRLGSDWSCASIKNLLVAGCLPWPPAS